MLLFNVIISSEDFFSSTCMSMEKAMAATEYFTVHIQQLNLFFSNGVFISLGYKFAAQLGCLSIIHTLFHCSKFGP